MGADWYAATVIGIRVPKDKVVREETYFRNNCICKPRQRGPEVYPEASFCPTCGKLIRRKCVRDVVLFDGLTPWKNGSSICGWPVYTGTDGMFFYIGVFVVEVAGEYDKKSPLPNISKDTVIKFRRAMEKAGLWDQEEFGMWTILTCSY